MRRTALIQITRAQLVVFKAKPLMAIKGATVGLDLNFNGKLDVGEPTTITGNNGAYILDIKSRYILR